MEFVRDLSTLHIAKDAPLGSVIAEITDGYTIVKGGTNLTLSCLSDGNPPSPMQFKFVAAAPIFPTPCHRSKTVTYSRPTSTVSAPV